MTARQAQLLGAARQVALSVGAVVGAACILLTLAALLFDLRPLVFRSGSMAPTIDTGALAIAHGVDASTIAVGQIVSVPTSSGERVTHRVVQVEMQGDKAVLWLQGDANRTPDASPYVVDHADKVLFSVPWVGYLLGWLTGPIGLFALGLYAAFLLSVILRPGGGGDADRAGPVERPRRGGGRHTGSARSTGGVMLALVVGLGAGGVSEGRVTPTLAAFTDGSGVTGTSNTAYTVPAPDNSTCTPAGNSTTREMDFTWPANLSPLPTLSYNSTVAGLTTSVASFDIVGATQYFRVTWPAGNNFNTVVTVTATGFPTGVLSWLGPTSSWKFKTAGSKTNIPTCGEVDPPVIVFTEPHDGATMTRAAEISALSTACTNSAPACGTRTDASTISSTQFHFERTIGSTVTCWNTSWSTANCGTQWRNVTLSGNVWRLGGTASNAYGSAATYSLSVQVTDSWNNVATQTITFNLT